MFNKKSGAGHRKSDAELKHLADVATAELARREAARLKRNIGLSGSGDAYYILVNGTKFGPFTFDELRGIRELTADEVTRVHAADRASTGQYSWDYPGSWT